MGTELIQKKKKKKFLEVEFWVKGYVKSLKQFLFLFHRS